MKRALAPGWNAVVTNWRPFVAIQIVCVLLVISYYMLPAVQRACTTLAELKANGGVLFAALSVAIAAVVIPEIARRLTRAPRDKPFTIGDLMFQFAYFAVLGIAIDALYRCLGVIFGDDPSPLIVLQKVLFDMILFSGVFSMPLAVVLFAWRDGDFKVRNAQSLLRKGGFWERYFPLIITCWAFWAPVMGCLYSLPVDLQFVFAVLAEAAWCLLLVTAASRTPDIDKTIA
jgi:hypothetical protein